MPGDEHMRDGMRYGIRFRLPAGMYAVDRIDSVQGTLLDGEKPTEFSAEFTRLRLVK